MGRVTTKIRPFDWDSVRKAINQLSSSKLGSGASPTFKSVYVTNNISLGGSQITDFTIEKVADEAARLALDFVTGKICFQIDEGTMWLATSY